VRELEFLLNSSYSFRRSKNCKKWFGGHCCEIM